MNRPYVMCLAGAALAGVALFPRTAAADVVAVVSADSPEATMSTHQVVDIFLGRASRFPDGRPAVPIDQAEGSAARDEFYLTYAGKSPAQLNAHWSRIIFTGRGRPPREAADGAEVKRFVIRNPDAIGYIDRSLVNGSVKVLLSK